MNKKNKNQNQPKEPLVPPALSAVFSAVLPGLGQAFSRELRRGILLLLSFLTIGGLLVWRVFQAGRRYKDLAEKISKAYTFEPALKIITVLFILFYIWIIIDAFLLAKKRKGGLIISGAGILFFALLIFFILGWQIGGIEPITFFSRIDQAVPTFSRVLWPWEKAVVYPKEITTTKAEIQSPCTDTPFESSFGVQQEPYLFTNPTCGDPSKTDGTPGTTFTLVGKGFDPETEVEIWWRDPINNEFRQRMAGEYVTFFPEEDGSFEKDVIMPYRMIPPVAGEGPKIWQVQGRQLASIGKGEISSELKLTIEKMIETIFIGMMATFFGILLAIPFSFLAAKNLMGENALTLGIYYIVRTVMNIIRSIEPLIWAIIAVIVVGLGPFAGIIALTVHSMAALAKLYSEAIENIDPGPIEAIHATGANWIQTIAFAVIPQIIPPFVSFTVYRWDINIRMSTVIGFVGGGGIGFLLQQWIRLLDYRSAGMAVWFIAFTVMILDYVSSEVREKYT
jgi:phosphonate transport system permease protein